MRIENKLKAKFLIYGLIIGISFTGIFYEAQNYIQIKAENVELKSHIERIENIKDNGGPVESSVKTESQVEPIKAKAEDLSSAPASGEIEKLIYEVAKEKKFEFPEILIRIAKAESSFDPCAKNPNSSATGLFQILDMHGLTKDERCNPEIATAWAITHFAGGRPWNSSRSKWDI